MLSTLLPPLFGGIIGYITNDIAIRMLFRPQKAWYVCGIHVPFTPGIIPKEKGRIAKAMGDAISENLINKDVLERTLLSQEILDKIIETFDGFCRKQSKNEESLQDFISHYLTEDELHAITDSGCEELEKVLTEKLAASNFGQDIAHIATEHAMEKVSGSLLGVFGAEKLISPIAGLVEPMLAKEINQMIQGNSAPMVHKMVLEQSQNLLKTPMKTFFDGHEEQIQQAKEAILSIYRTIILEHLPKMLSSLNISQMIEQRINEMDMQEIEPIIFSVLKKELKAIVWFGAALGALIGCVNLMI